SAVADNFEEKGAFFGEDSTDAAVLDHHVEISGGRHIGTRGEHDGLAGFEASVDDGSAHGWRDPNRAWLARGIVGDEETLTAQEPSDDRCEEGPDRGSKARVRTDREFGFHLNVIGFGGHGAGLR